MALTRWFLFAALIVAFLAGAAAQQTEAGPDERAASLQRLVAVAEEYTIKTGGSEQRLELVKAPVLRYSDPVSSIADGVVLIWTNAGRPEAVMALHHGSRDRTWIEYQSLSLSPLDAVGINQPNWRPREPGVAFKPLDGAPSPENDAPERLAQMRSMLRPFSASVSDNQGGRQELRLLSRPIFRYAQTDRGIIDGALFAFVRATNPELLILVEAQIVDGQPQWHYSPARFTGRACELRFKDQPIWSHDVLPRPKDPAASYFQSY